MQAVIEAAFANPNNPTDSELPGVIQEVITGLDNGSLRVAEKRAGAWIINEWVKKAILLYFRTQQFSLFEGGYSNFWDKVPLKYAGFTAEQFAAQGVRVVPPAM